VASYRNTGVTVSRCENVSLLVKLRFLYKGRDGQREGEFEATKRFSRPFIPQIGSTIYAVYDADAVGGRFSARVSEVGWRSYAACDEILIYTETQVFCDGDVAAQLHEHGIMLAGDGWSCKDIR